MSFKSHTVLNSMMESLTNLLHTAHGTSLAYSCSMYYLVLFTSNSLDQIHCHGRAGTMCIQVTLVLLTVVKKRIMIKGGIRT